MVRFGVTIAAALLLATAFGPLRADDYTPGDAPTCENGKGIERTLGMHGYRVVVSGGGRESQERVIKFQVWQNEADEWVLTERFLRDRRTCVVRSGAALHMMY